MTYEFTSEHMEKLVEEAGGSVKTRILRFIRREFITKIGSVHRSRVEKALKSATSLSLLLFFLSLLLASHVSIKFPYISSCYFDQRDFLKRVRFTYLCCHAFAGIVLDAHC